MKQMIFLLLALASIATSAKSLRDLLIDEKGEVFPTLTQSMRATMISNYADSTLQGTMNRIGEESKITHMSDDFIALETSAGQTVELKLLTQGSKDTVIVMIETVKIPVQDSHLSFYDSNWKPLKNSRKVMDIPTMADFIKTGTPKAQATEILREIDFPLIGMKFDGNRLVAKQMMPEFYVKTDYQKFAPYLIDTIYYDIKGTQLTRQKANARNN